MCGIVGYVGPGNTPDLLIDGLRQLEYRGYDSWGLGVTGDDGISIVRHVGRISEGSAAIAKSLNGLAGIGHQRRSCTGPQFQQVADLVGRPFGAAGLQVIRGHRWGHFKCDNKRTEILGKR